MNDCPYCGSIGPDTPKNLSDFKRALSEDGDLIAPLKQQFGVDEARVVLLFMGAALKDNSKIWRIRAVAGFVFGVLCTAGFAALVRLFS